MMIRRCAVFGCDNTDEVRSSRFPLDKERAQRWKESLQLLEFPIELLQTKFIVCEAHFQQDDYDEMMQLKSSAIPALDLKQPIDIEVEDAPSIEIMPPTSLNLALLHPGVDNTKMNNSCHSTASTNNTDICVLETVESHYGEDGEDEEQGMLERYIDAAEFTVLHTPTSATYAPPSTHGAVDESTEVLLLVQSTCCSRNGKDSNNSHAYSTSGTDSDVEVLMSEEVLDTDWSSSVVALEESQRAPTSKATAQATVAADQSSSITTASLKQQEATTDQDISSVEEFSSSRSPPTADVDAGVEAVEENCYAHLTRAQLLRVIRDQAARIYQLETKLERYQCAQQKLFEHVDALRAEIGIGVCTSASVTSTASMDCQPTLETFGNAPL